MSKMIVVVFHDEKKAFEASRALKDLHRDGNISAYAGAIIARDASGKVSVKDEADQGPIGTALGMMTGALIGLIAGPEGMVVGAAAGGLAGSIGDLVNLGVGGDFLDEVASKLEPGMVAVVAEIEEYWTTPVDTTMEKLGGLVFRRWRMDVEEDQINRDIAAARRDYDELKTEIKTTHQDNKAKLQAKIEDAKSKLEDAGDRAKAKIDSLKKEYDAKVAAVQAQVSTAKAEAKEKLETRKAELKTEHEQRSSKLKQAWNLTKEALAP